MTLMEQETREAPQAVQRFLDANGKAVAMLGGKLRDLDPPFILTSARGSSDNAAGFLKYMAEIILGVPCASIGASVASIYGAQLKAKGALAVTISQSGKSPDIVALQAEARRAGALTIAMVNAPESPAADAADVFLPLCAGPELSVAATKSFIVSLAAGALLVAEWSDDEILRKAVHGLPTALDAAMRSGWQEVSDKLDDFEQLYVLGRGPSLPVAMEVSLKLKETCAIHAEAYSIAEVMHGPLELVRSDFPILTFAQNDAALPTTLAAIQRLKLAGARVQTIGSGGFVVPDSGHPLLEPVVMTQVCYLAIESLARRRGRNPDLPRLLQKVTQTR